MPKVLSSVEVPSLRSEAAQATTEILSEVLSGTQIGNIIAQLEGRCLTISEAGGRGATTTLKGYQETIGYFKKVLLRHRAKYPTGSPLSTTPLPNPEPEPPAAPLTMAERILQGAVKVPEVEELDPVSLMTALNDYPDEDDRRKRRIGKFQHDLGDALGAHLEALTKETLQLYLKGGPKALEDIDLPPVVLDQRGLVPDGEGPWFDKRILIIQSFTVAIPQGVIVKRDYRLNGSGATQSHPNLVQEINSTKMIRSTKKRTPNGELQFYAKAFTVENGDTLVGYLNRRVGVADTHGKDLPEFERQYVIREGKVEPTLP